MTSTDKKVSLARLGQFLAERIQESFDYLVLDHPLIDGITLTFDPTRYNACEDDSLFKSLEEAARADGLLDDGEELERPKKLAKRKANKLTKEAA